jgi:hypothetical protein
MTSPDPVQDARRRLRRLTGKIPAMSEVPALIAPVRNLGNVARDQLDALVILGRASGMTWQQIATALGTTRQGALQRHVRALKRVEVLGR